MACCDNRLQHPACSQAALRDAATKFKLDHVEANFQQRSLAARDHEFVFLRWINQRSGKTAAIDQRQLDLCARLRLIRFHAVLAPDATQRAWAVLAGLHDNGTARSDLVVFLSSDQRR